MREINALDIEKAVYDLALRANVFIDKKTLKKIENA